jgi:hypothetical protein
LTVLTHDALKRCPIEDLNRSRARSHHPVAPELTDCQMPAADYGYSHVDSPLPIACAIKTFYTVSKVARPKGAASGIINLGLRPRPYGYLTAQPL